MKRRQIDWDRWFIGLAHYVSSASKDPSTKCGAVIVRPDKTICSVGYNGFPRGVEDALEHLSNREEKYQRIVHAEMNAILSARENLHGYTIYVTPGNPWMAACDRCFVHIIQAGIARIVFERTSPTDFNNRWKENCLRSLSLAKEAKINVCAISMEDVVKHTPLKQIDIFETQ